MTPKIALKTTLIPSLKVKIINIAIFLATFLQVSFQASLYLP